MFSIFFYIGPAVVVRYLFLGRPLGKFAAVCFCGLLFLGLFFIAAMAHSADSPNLSSLAASGTPIWILIASVWSYFILRAKSRESQSSAPTSSPHLWPKPSPDSVEPKPKEVVKSITEPTIEPASRPAENPKKKEPVDSWVHKPKEVVKPITEPTIEPTSRPAENPKKKEPVEKEKLQMRKAHDDEEFYEQVAAELEEGSRKKGLWLKAETKAEGDADKARFLYIRWRVEQLAEAELDAQREEGERQRLAEEERQRLAEEERQRLAEEERQRLVEEARHQSITTLKEANECIAPLVRYGYSVQMTTFDNAPSWRVFGRQGDSRPVGQSKLKLYVYDQIKLHGYDTTIQPCEKCGEPMEELGEGVWHCNDCA